MSWKASPPAIETAVLSFAAACLGGAVGFAVARIAPFGAGHIEATAVGAIVAFGVWMMSGRVDRQRGSRGSRVTPVQSLADLLVHEDVLLDQHVDDDILLLDDPLPVIDDESCVVRLFALQPSGAEAVAPYAGPGEMVARIENFLGQDRGSAAGADPERRADNKASDDASAALHAALADIRRSLRQG